MALTPGSSQRWRMRYYKWNLTGTTFTYTDMGEILGATDRSFTFQLNKPDTIAFTLPMTVPMGPVIAANEEGYILLYRNGTLVMVAEIDTIEVTADDTTHNLAVTAMETLWSRLQTAILGTSTAGLAGPTSPTDQGTWLTGQLTAYNSTTFVVLPNTYETNIHAGSVTASGNISGGVWRYKPFMELMQELSASTAGFDFWATPLDPALNVGVTGNLNIAPLKGTTKANAVFEYGTGSRSAQSYRYLVDSSQMSNLTYVLPPGFPDNAGLKVAVGTDFTSTQRRGVRTTVIDSDLNDYTLRGNYAALAMAVRGHPRHQVMVQPAYDDGSGRVPAFVQDYTTGDTVTAHIVDQGTTFINASVRVYSVNVALDENGLETLTLGLVNEA